MSRFYVPKESIKGNQVLIIGKEAHHILDVMRLKVSDNIVVFDGTGNEYVGIVKGTGNKSLSLEITQTRKTTPQENSIVTLIQAIPKKEKMDYIVEKATELGVNCVMPVTTARTIPDWSESKKAGIVTRWQKISQEAAKQCGRMVLPEIEPVKTLEEALSHINGYDLKLIAALSDNAIKLKDALKSCSGGKIAVAIGPEGDFTEEEIKQAEEKGFKIVNLGRRVLKSDTAGLAVLAMINYEYTN